MVIHDFRLDQLDFSGTSLTFQPADVLDPSTTHIFLDTKKYADYFLSLSGECSGSILINNQMVFQPDSAFISQTWSIDSLAQLYKTDSVLISLNGTGVLAVQVIQKGVVQSSSILETERLQKKKAQYGRGKNLWVTLLLFLGLTFGIYRMKYPKSFSSLFDLSDILRLRPRDSFFYELRIMQGPSLIHYLSLATLFTLYTSKNWSSLGLEVVLTTNMLITLALIFVLSLIYPFCKFIVISFFSGLFGLNSFTKFHYMESVRLTIVILSLSVLASFIPIDTTEFFGSNVLLVGLFGLSIALIFLKLLNKTLDKKLYLFSYICTTEIIPLLFIIKIFK